eukprot:s2_g11.t1
MLRTKEVYADEAPEPPPSRAPTTDLERAAAGEPSAARPGGTSAHSSHDGDGPARSDDTEEPDNEAHHSEPRCRRRERRRRSRSTDRRGVAHGQIAFCLAEFGLQNRCRNAALAKRGFLLPQLAGAATVVDKMEGLPADLAVVNLKRDLLEQTNGLAVEELQKMLQDRQLFLVCHLCGCDQNPGWQETETALAGNSSKEQRDAMVLATASSDVSMSPTSPCAATEAGLVIDLESDAENALPVDMLKFEEEEKNSIEDVKKKLTATKSIPAKVSPVTKALTPENKAPAEILKLLGHAPINTTDASHSLLKTPPVQRSLFTPPAARPESSSGVAKAAVAIAPSTAVPPTGNLASPPAVVPKAHVTPKPPPMLEGAEKEKGDPPAGTESVGAADESDAFNLANKAEFSSQMKRVREIQTSREETLHGGWYTEEKMRSELKYGKPLGRKYDGIAWLTACLNS